MDKLKEPTIMLELTEVESTLIAQILSYAILHAKDVQLGMRLGHDYTRYTDVEFAIELSKRLTALRKEFYETKVNPTPPVKTSSISSIKGLVK